MPEEGVEWIPHLDVLSFEEIVEVVKVAVNLGISKIRLTGGEPLVRKGISDLVRMIAAIPGVEDLAMTTNAIFLEQFVGELAEAGLKRINVSLDTLDPGKYKHLTRGGDINKVMRGLKAAEKAGFKPIKINCVITGQTTAEDKEQLRSFCAENNYRLRFIREMSLTDGEFYPVEGGKGGRCNICNRIRLTARGEVIPCLFSEDRYNIRDWGIGDAILMAVGAKPASGKKNKINTFYNIGG